MGYKYYLYWPVPSSTTITSKYGYRNCPYHGYELHAGCDISASHGAVIRAAYSGTARVYKATYTGGKKNNGWNYSYGHHIDLYHTGGGMTRYAHMASFAVSDGEKVQAGQTIGYVDSTGSSTGNHCHFEFRPTGGSPIDPRSSSIHYNYGASGGTGGSGGGSGGGSSTPTKDDVKAATGSSGQSTADMLRTLTGSTITSGGTTVTESVPETKDITTVTIKSTQGTAKAREASKLGEAPTTDGLEILIQHKSTIYRPVLTSQVTLEQYRSGSPSKLKFTVMKDETLDIKEGDPICLRYNGSKVFYGYIFEKSRKDLHQIDVMAYDQIRYLKNRDSLNYADITYADLLKKICSSYSLTAGTIADTEYKIPARIEEGTLLDILGNASDETLINKGKLYVLYDDYGAISLKAITDMKLPLYIDESTVQSIDYRTTIDDKVYNRIKLAVDNSTTGVREMYVTDGDSQSTWGVLQYYEKYDSADGLQTVGSELLKRYEKLNRRLKLSGAFGDVRVRGGTSLVACLNLGDMKLNSYMVVEEVKHIWSAGSYTMDMTVIGHNGEFTA